VQTMTTSFSLRIFVADGDPDGLRIVEKSNWIGKALVFPRALLPQVKARPELAQTGVYLILGPRPDGEGNMLYVGEGEGEGDPIRSDPASAGESLCAKGFLDSRYRLHHHHGWAAQQGACAVFRVAPYRLGSRREAHAAGQRQSTCRAVTERG
jgi:hypothetical protein